jgi:hypothetical protein
MIHTAYIVLIGKREEKCIALCLGYYYMRCFMNISENAPPCRAIPFMLHLQVFDTLVDRAQVLFDFSEPPSSPRLGI